MLRNKRGQTTLFVIIAIIIVASVLLIIFLKPKIFPISEKQARFILSSQIEPIKEAISKCTYEVSREGFNLLGSQAGYYKADYLFSYQYPPGGNFYSVVLMNSGGKKINRFPSIRQMEKEFQHYMENEGYKKIDRCLNNFKDFKVDVSSDVEKRKIYAEINDNNVVIKTEWPLTISKTIGNKKVSTNIRPKDIRLEIPLGTMWRIANEIIEDGMDNKINLDRSIRNNPFAYSLIKYNIIQHYPTSDQVIIDLESIPRGIETPYHLRFAINLK